MEIPDWAKDIQELRATLQLSQQALAETLGVSQAIVSKWGRGEKMPSAKLFGRLADLAPDASSLQRRLLRHFSKRDPDVIRMAGDIARRRREQRLLAPPPQVSSSDVVLLPVLHDAAAAGSPRMIEPGEIERGIAMPRFLVPREEDTVVIKIAGDSMAPLLLEGFLVGVDTSQREPRRLVNEMVLARDPEGGVTVKWLRKHKELMLVPQHTSPRNPVVLLNREHGWAILGKVEWWIGQPPKA